MSSGAFWVAISYRLAACFTGIGVCVELKFIGDCSSILGTIITPWGKQGKKMTKMGQKLRCFCTFSVFVLLKFSTG